MASDLEYLLENKSLESMLDFETQIFLDLLHKDGLVVAARGLNMDRVLTNILKVYADEGNLVLVLNCSESEEKYFTEKLNHKDVHSITFETSISDREEMYLSGGIHFITTRILVVDMLKKRIPIDKITGIIILKAHTILESCQEAFVLRIYRQHNKNGFIKGFSNCAESFTVGFGQVERVMRTLFVKELYLWPRFHSIVIQSLKNYEPTVIELHIPISDIMLKIQTCILDLMNLTVKEIKRINKTLELQEITVENCLTKKFHTILQNQLDCVWHQLSSKTKQLIADLKTLRHLILIMLHSDPVTFYATVLRYRSMEYVQASNWVLLEPAELLFTHSSSLVYTTDKELSPEFCPKWKPLSDILRVEIPAEAKRLNILQSKILILCQDHKTCHQLNHFLTYGPRHYLFSMALKQGLPFKSVNDKFRDFENLPEFQSQKECETAQKKNISKRSKNTSIKSTKIRKSDVSTDIGSEKESKNENSEESELETLRDSYILTVSQSSYESLNSEGSSDTKEDEFVFEPFSQMENMNLTQLCEAATPHSQQTVLIRTFKSNDNFLGLQTTLEEMQPHFIIMYHSNITAIRNIELYEARRNKEAPLKIYFLIHAGTVEEQSYLTTLRREKEAFEYLIDVKSTMVIPEDQDGKSEDCTALQIDTTLEEINTRKGGKAERKSSERNFIIVDMREFRSELPALIHKRGIDIEPLTISVGDYILTPEICIERKSISDLIGSLNSGRLYQQCTQMCRNYSKPMLLIEFDQNRVFSWQNNYMLSNDEDNFHIQQKIILLTMHFPKLKLVWSPSPYATAQLFEELKIGKQQPDIAFASSLGSEQDLDIVETKYNVNVYDFIQKLPGINSKNIDSFLRKTGNFKNVIKLSEEELKDILGNSKDAKEFYNILHNENLPEGGTAHTKKMTKKTGKTKFKFTKKKT